MAEQQQQQSKRRSPRKAASVDYMAKSATIFDAATPESSRLLRTRRQNLRLFRTTAIDLEPSAGATDAEGPPTAPVLSSPRPPTFLSSVSVTELQPHRRPLFPKTVRFSDVEVFYFARNQGFSVVPTFEGVSLGMETNHYHSECYPLNKHAKISLLQTKKKMLFIRKVLEENKKCKMPSRRADSTRRASGAPSGDHLEPAEANIEAIVTSLLSEMIDQVAVSCEADRYLSDDDSDNNNDVPEMDSDWAVRPLESKVRYALLQHSSVDCDLSDNKACRQIRTSRNRCGCTCRGPICSPTRCQCALNGIKCQVDRDGFPCACKATVCGNPMGKVIFDPARVRSHYLTTLQRLRDSEKLSIEPESYLPHHIVFPDSDDEHNASTPQTSYCPTPPSEVYLQPRNSLGDPNANNAAQTSTPTTKTTHRKYPVTPTYPKAPGNLVLDSTETNGTHGALQKFFRSEENRTILKRPSMTSIVMTQNVSSPVTKRPRSRTDLFKF